MQSSCSSHSVHKLSSHHSSALDMSSPVGSPLLLQPLLLPQGPRPPPCRPPVGLSHLGKPAQKTTRICSCRRCWQSAAVSRQHLGKFVFCCLSTSGQAKRCHLVVGKDVKQVVQILARLLPSAHWKTTQQFCATRKNKQLSWSSTLQICSSRQGHPFMMKDFDYFWPLPTSQVQKRDPKTSFYVFIYSQGQCLEVLLSLINFWRDR